MSRCRTQAILTSHINTFVFLEPDQWNSPKEIEKEKNVNSTLVFFLPQNPQGNFTDFRTLKRLLGGKDQCSVWSRIIVLSTIIHYHTIKTLICLLGGSKFKKLVCVVNYLFMWAQLFKEIKVFQTCHYTSFQSHSLAMPADVRPPTLDDGVVGHCLHILPVIIKRQVPHP